MRPKVTAVWAMSWDGKIATASDEAEFPSRADRARLHRLRAESDAILVGARTASVAQTAFGLSEEGRAHRREIGKSEAPPLVVVVSGRGSADPSARLLREGPRERIVVALGAGVSMERRGLLAPVAQIVDLAAERPMSALLESLAARGIREVLCEGGGEMFASLRAEEAIDRAMVTICPLVLGGREAPTAAGGPATALADGRRWRLSEWRSEDCEGVAVYECEPVLRGPVRQEPVSPGQS